MTIGPSNLRALKVPLSFLRTGAVRWFETVNTNFQSIVQVFSQHLREQIYTGSGSGAVGRLVCRNPTALGSGLDSVTSANNNTTTKYPTQILYAANGDNWFGRTMGLTPLASPPNPWPTPGTVAYLNAASPGNATADSSSGVIVGIFCASPYLLFLPHN